MQKKAKVIIVLVVSLYALFSAPAAFAMTIEGGVGGFDLRLCESQSYHPFLTWFIEVLFLISVLLAGVCTFFAFQRKYIPAAAGQPPVQQKVKAWLLVIGIVLVVFGGGLLGLVYSIQRRLEPLLPVPSKSESQMIPFHWCQKTQKCINEETEKC